MKHWTDKLVKLGACQEAIEWGKRFSSMQAAWLVCERGDHMLWLIGKLSGEPGCDKRKQLVLTACKCARLALPYIEKGELRPLKAIETAEQWARGENGVTLDDVRHAAYAAAAAANTAAYAADYAADYAAAYAAAAAAAADYAAYAADYAAAAAYARKETLAQCADIVRTDYPNVDNLFEAEKVLQ
ncbi:MAG: hypothetical protein PHG53_09615 [Phycisphaerae bacterium]|nr:hypothetical protein [Phycisphaerae bacterium]